MEFVNKASLIEIVDNKLKELNDERGIIRQQQGSTEEKRPRLDNVAMQEAIMIRFKNDICDIITYKTDNVLVIRGN